jgi:heme A synthase
MTPTRIRLLIGLAVIAAAVGLGAVMLVEGQSGRVIPVPWLAGATMWFLALALLIWTLLSRPRLLRKPGSRPLPPLVAARTAALAMAASRTGSLVAGFYAGIAIGSFPSRATQAGSAAVAAALTTAVGSLALVVSALWLERLCRLPLGGDRDGTGGPGRGQAGERRPEPGGTIARIGSRT